MDVLTGNTFFLETNELIVDVKNGNSSVATTRGGFRVESSAAGGANTVALALARLTIAGARFPRAAAAAGSPPARGRP